MKIDFLPFWCTAKIARCVVIDCSKHSGHDKNVSFYRIIIINFDIGIKMYNVMCNINFVVTIAITTILAWKSKKESL